MTSTSRDSGGPLLAVEDLRVTFDGAGGSVIAVDGVSFSLERGDCLGIVGESGSGKSVTVSSMLGLTPALALTTVTGKVLLDGRNLFKMRRSQLRKVRGGDVGFVFQNPLTSLNPSICIGDQISEVLREHGDYSRAAARKKSAELLGLVGIPDPVGSLSRYPEQFSGGMRQRILIATAIACEPRLLIADEATTALDPTVQVQILKLLAELREKLGMAMIVISHDLGVVSALCNKIQVMYGGRIVESGPTRDVLGSPRHPYTAGLLRLIPRLDMNEHKRLRPIPGMALTVVSGRTGHDCRFSARCDVAFDRCHVQEPPWTSERGHGGACWRSPGTGAEKISPRTAS